MTIDSLINKYEEKIQNIKKQWGEDKFHYHTNEIKVYEEILKDLKRLKNEIHYIDTSKLETDGIKEETLIDVELIKLKERQTNQLNCDLFEKCCKLQNENTELKQIISSTKNHLDLYKFGLEALKREVEEDLETEVLEGINTINKDFLEVINEAIAELKEYLRSD